MNVEEFLKSLSASTESRASVKFESNSKGTNVTVHVYSNATKEDCDNAVKMAVYTHKQSLAEATKFQ